MDMRIVAYSNLKDGKTQLEYDDDMICVAVDDDQFVYMTHEDVEYLYKFATTMHELYMSTCERKLTNIKDLL
jgi:hypothetical protein